MRDREISVSDLNQLRLWVETRPEVPEGDWYKDFGSFKVCGSGSYLKKPSDHDMRLMACHTERGLKAKPAHCKCVLIALRATKEDENWRGRVSIPHAS